MTDQPVCLITGPTHGIGRVAAKAISAAGFRLVLACRNVELGKALAAELANDATVLHCDLADLESVARLCSQVLDTQQRLDRLVNNAGIMTTDRARIGALDAMMAVNHVGHFLLTTSLVDLLNSTPESRIVNVASRAHQRARMELDDPLCARSHATGMAAYQQSKLANVLFTLALSRRLEGTTTTCNALHPGVVGTNIMRSAGGWLRLAAPLVRPLMLSEERGARSLLYLTLDDEARHFNGKYLNEHLQVTAPSALARNEALQDSLWQASEATVAAYRSPARAG